MSIVLGSGVQVTVAPPTAPPAVVVPVRGPQGPPGPPGGDAFFVEHAQDTPQAVWTFTHDPGTPVAWSLWLTDGQLGWNYTVEQLDETNTRVSMDDPVAGTIRILMRRI